LEPPVKIAPELAAVSLVMTVKRRLSVHKFIHNPSTRKELNSESKHNVVGAKKRFEKSRED
jgi:hypothetical protein